MRKIISTQTLLFKMIIRSLNEFKANSFTTTTSVTFWSRKLFLTIFYTLHDTEFGTHDRQYPLIYSNLSELFLQLTL